MTTEQKQQIVAAMEDYLAGHKMSQNAFAKASGVSAAYLSAIRNGKETMDNSHGGEPVVIADKYYELIAAFIGRDLKKAYWETRPTAQLTETMAILEDARLYAYTNVIIGDTGCGKSYAVELFRRKYPTDVVVITVSRLDNIGDLLDKIIDALKITPALTKSKKMRLIVERLRNLKLDGGHPVLIFDESEYMKQAALCMMKEFYDNLRKYCAVVMMGHPQLENTINKLRKKNKDGIPQLYRRIKFGIRHLAKIDPTYRLFIGELKDAKLRKFLQFNCDNYGELHDVLVPAMREAERTGEELNEAFVRRLLNMPDETH
jgi:DNA transposition AAA+ family ATPase